MQGWLLKSERMMAVWLTYESRYKLTAL